jgi:hypothetical protein
LKKDLLNSQALPPILNEFDQMSRSLEIHPGEDLFDGETMKCFKSG